MPNWTQAHLDLLKANPEKWADFRDKFGSLPEDFQPPAAPAAALELLKANPDKAPDFEAKYGYIPATRVEPLAAASSTAGQPPVPLFDEVGNALFFDEQGRPRPETYAPQGPQQAFASPADLATSAKAALASGAQGLHRIGLEARQKFAPTIRAFKEGKLADLDSLEGSAAERRALQEDPSYIAAQQRLEENKGAAEQITQEQADLERRNPSLLAKGSLTAAASAPTSIGALATGLVAGPAAAATVMGASTLGTEFQEASETRNRSLGARLGTAAIGSGIEIGTEYFGFNLLLKPGGSAIKKLATSLAAELGGESVATVTQRLNQFLAAQDGEITLQDIIDGSAKGVEELPRTWVSTLLMSSVQSGAVSAAQAAGSAIQKRAARGAYRDAALEKLSADVRYQLEELALAPPELDAPDAPATDTKTVAGAYQEGFRKALEQNAQRPMPQSVAIENARKEAEKAASKAADAEFEALVTAAQEPPAAEVTPEPAAESTQEPTPETPAEEVKPDAETVQPVQAEQEAPKQVEASEALTEDEKGQLMSLRAIAAAESVEATVLESLVSAGLARPNPGGRPILTPAGRRLRSSLEASAKPEAAPDIDLAAPQKRTESNAGIKPADIRPSAPARKTLTLKTPRAETEAVTEPDTKSATSTPVDPATELADLDATNDGTAPAGTVRRLAGQGLARLRSDGTATLLPAGRRRLAALKDTKLRSERADARVARRAGVSIEEGPDGFTIRSAKTGEAITTVKNRETAAEVVRGLPVTETKTDIPQMRPRQRSAGGKTVTVAGKPVAQGVSQEAAEEAAAGIEGAQVAESQAAADVRIEEGPDGVTIRNAKGESIATVRDRETADALVSGLSAQRTKTEQPQMRKPARPKPAGKQVKVKGEVVARGVEETAAREAAEGVEGAEVAESRPFRSATPRRTQENSEEFRRWFKDSKAVDEDGDPLTLFHGTRSEFLSFDPARTGSQSGNRGIFGEGFYFTEDPRVASEYAGSRNKETGGQVLPVYLSLQNPFQWSESRSLQDFRNFIVSLNGATTADKEAAEARSLNIRGYSSRVSSVQSVIESVGISRFTELLRKNGYDGVVMETASPYKETAYADERGRPRTFEYVAFTPEQIKSATGNVGRFDPALADISQRRAATTESRAAANKELDRRMKLTQDVAAEILRETGIEVRVARTSADVPTNIRETVKRSNGFVVRSPDGTVEAWIMASGADNSTRQGIMETALHEVVGHKGLRALLDGSARQSLEDARAGRPPSKYAETMAAIRRSFPSRVAELAKRNGIPLDSADPAVREFNLNRAAEEVVAYAAGEVLQFSPNRRKLTVWDRIIGKVRDALRGIGLLKGFSDQDIARLILRSRDFLARQALDSKQRAYEAKAARVTSADSTLEAAASMGPAVEHTVRGNIVTASIDGATMTAEIMRERGLLWVKSANVPRDLRQPGRGSGLGVAMAQNLAKQAQALGLKLVSDNRVSDNAARVYDALERRGYDIKRNPARQDPGTGELVSVSELKPVFEVTPPSDLAASKSDKIRFKHFSNLKDEKVTLDPSFQGTGIKGRESARGGTKVTSLYPEDLADSDIEQELKGKTKYVVDIPASELYDASADPLDLKAKAQTPVGWTEEDGKRVPNRFTFSMNKYEELIRDAGFSGYLTPSASGILRGQARLFKAVPAQRADLVPDLDLSAPKPRGKATVNIGLDIPGGGKNTEAQVRKVLREAGVKVIESFVQRSNTEDTVIAVLDRALTDAEADALSRTLNQEAIAQRVGKTGKLHGPMAEKWGPFNPDYFLSPPSKAQRAAQATITKVAKFLTPEERATVNQSTAKKLVDLFAELPSGQELAAAAIAGQAKRGWYRESAQAISNIFGPDAPRFAALLAALSPQTSVEANLQNTVETWKNWIAAGRPTDKRGILRVLSQSVMGNKGAGSVLDAWKNNSVRALSTENPEEITLSGPKVDSFMRNLLGEVNAVTLDTWMANFALIKQKVFAGGMLGDPKNPGKRFGYLAYSARVREAAMYLTEQTEETWTPAEVQETVWSWAKALTEEAEAFGAMSSAEEIIQNEELTDALINATPDFATLFGNEQYDAALREAGYGEQLDGLAGRKAAEQRGASRKKVEALAGDREKLLAAAQRLDKLIAARRKAKAADQALTEDGEVEIDFSMPGGPSNTGNANLDSFLDKIGQKPRTLKQIWQELTANLGARLRIGVFDRFFGIKRAEDLAGISTADSGYVSLRLAQSSSELVQSMLEYGHPVWNGGAADIAGNQGFIQILAPLGDKVNLFMAYLVARRADRLMTEGRERLFDQVEIDAAKNLDQQHPEFKVVAKQYADFQKKVLDFAQQAGVIDPQSRALWENADYIPFYRMIENGQVSGSATAGDIGHIRNQIRRLTGGQENLGDPLENITRNWLALMDASLKAHAVRQIVDNLNGTGLVTKAPPVEPVEVLVPGNEIKKWIANNAALAANLQSVGIDPAKLSPAMFAGLQKMMGVQAPTAEDVISVWRNGKREYWKIHDPLLFRSFQEANAKSWGAWMEFFRLPRRLLTATIISTPGFVVRNTLRDMWHAFVQGTRGGRRIPIVPILDTIKGTISQLRMDPDSQSTLAGGGGFMSGYVSAGDTAAAAAQIRRTLKSGLTPAGILNSPARLWQFYSRILNSSENSHRVQIYKRELAAGKTRKEALFEARDMLDFSMRGANPLVEFLTASVPFMNARLQGLYRLGGAIADNPAAVALRGLMLTAITAGVFALGGDDDRYRELGPDQKAMYWHFWDVFEEDDHWRFPKPFEVGAIFASVPEAILDAAVTNAEEPDAAMQSLKFVGHMFGESLNMKPEVQTVWPILELAMNKDTFRQAPILTAGDEKVLPAQQDSPRVSPTYRMLANAMPEIAPDALRSPKQLEHLGRGYIGSIQDYVLTATDYLLRVANDEPSPETREPVLVREFKSTGPTRSSRYVNSMYEIAAEADKVVQSIKRLEDQEDDRADVEIERLETEKAPLIAVEKDFEKATKAVGKLQKQQRNIRLNKEMTPDQKKQEIDTLQQEINDIAKDVYDLRPGSRLNPEDAAKLIGQSSATQQDILREAGLPATAKLLALMA